MSDCMVTVNLNKKTEPKLVRITFEDSNGRRLVIEDPLTIEAWILRLNQAKRVMGTEPQGAFRMIEPDGRTWDYKSSGQAQVRHISNEELLYRLDAMAMIRGISMSEIAPDTEMPDGRSAKADGAAGRERLGNL